MFPLFEIRQQGAFRERQEIFAVRETTEAEPGKIDPFHREILTSRRHGDPPGYGRTVRSRAHVDDGIRKFDTIGKNKPGCSFAVRPPDRSEVAALKQQRIADEIAQADPEQTVSFPFRGNKFHISEFQ